MGLGVPYWYYISGNGLEKEQIPTKTQMESQLSKYIKETKKCDFSSFIEQGYNISIEDATSAKATIADDNIRISVSQRLSISYGDTKFIASNHNTQADSSLGKLYGLAQKIYSYEKDKMFLENYSLDVLHTYAPVDGVLLQCSPAVWNPYEVADNLKSALTANIGMIKMSGEYYISKNKINNYFVTGKDSNIDLTGEQVRFQYSADWPSRIEIWPTKNNIMSADPVGTQPGLNAMGFCYVPYKFVYDMYFPVLVQVLNTNNPQEIFQFPFAIVISKNAPREAAASEYIEQTESICDKANSDLTVNTYNVNLLPVEADIQFKCFNDVCDLGRTKINNATGLSSLAVKVPQCINGFLTAKAEGYADKKYIISTNEESSADLVLDKKYTLPLEIYVDDSLTNELSVLSISKNSEGVSNAVDSVSYPFSRQISIAEGDYSFDLKVYKNGAINIPATTTTQCVTMPKEGVLGILGLTEDKCTDLTIPSQTLSNYVYAGGKQNDYVTPSELEAAKVFRIFAKSVPVPQDMQQAQDNYEMVSTKILDIQIV